MSEILNLPKGHVILQSSTVTFPLQKAKYRVHKIYDALKDHEYEWCLDARQKRVDYNRLYKTEQALFAKKYGKLHPVLFDLIHSNAKLKKVEILVWLQSRQREQLKTNLTIRELTGDSIPGSIKESRAKVAAQTKTTMERLTKGLGLTLKRQSGIAPAFIAIATAEQIKRLATYEEIQFISLHEPKGIDDLQDSLNVSEGQQVVYVDGNRGSNIRVAVWEQGPDDTSNLVIEARYDSTPSTSSHARLTTGIIKNKEKRVPHGYAPDSKMYSANDYDTDALEWAVNDKSCRVISQSFHRESEESSGSLSSDDILKDYLVMHYPYPTIIQAAGNITSGETADEYVNHKGYNSLAVGNHNDSASAMSSGTTWRNPTSSHGDRELPEICANGTSVSAVGTTNSGTSFAAPAVAGSSAVLMGINGILKSWPEGVRAILLAGAIINVRGGNWYKDVINNRDTRDGAGALNLEESASITRRKVNPGNSPVHRGWDVGKLESGDFRSNGFAKMEYKIKVPRNGPTHVKVALTWDSQVWKLFWWYLGSFLTLDLDLKIYKGSTLVAHSSSWDNSYEIAEYDAEAGDELTIKIKRYSGNDWTYYGLAWTIF